MAPSTDPANPLDAGVPGYARLVLRTDDTTGNNVSEPASLALAAITLAGALVTRRRRTPGG